MPPSSICPSGSDLTLPVDMRSRSMTPPLPAAGQLALGGAADKPRLTEKSRAPDEDLPEGCTWGPTLFLSPRGVTTVPPLETSSGSRSISKAREAQGASPVFPSPKAIGTPTRPSSDPTALLPPSHTPHLPVARRSAQPQPESDSAAQQPQQVPVIWVDFPPLSPQDPFHFTRRRKLIIMVVALFFANITALESSSYAIGEGSMQRDLGMSGLQSAAGVALYGWGFAIGPLALAPLTEEFGRYWFYVGSVLCYTLIHLLIALASNPAMVLVQRFLLGITGCIGATVVAGTVADIYPPRSRGFPMSLFTLSVVIGPGLGPVIFCWVEANPHLEWRWIVWIQMIALGIYFPFVLFCLRETRASVLLRRRAKQLRKERGMQDGGRYTARSEVDKLKLLTALRHSLSRPLMFLALEPIVTFFAIWAALAWGVFFIQIAGLPVVFETIHGFGITSSGLTYLSLVIGSVIGFGLNFVQDIIYRRRVAIDGVEARLYAPMAAGLMLAIGCMIFGLTSIPSVTWVAPCVGIVIVLAAAYTIYQCCFVYLSECYGAHASSAVAGMSFLRILVGSSFAMFTDDMFTTLTPRWSLFLMGCIALVLAPIPFVAYFKGPWIRERSPFSKILMAEERRRVEAEKAGTNVIASERGREEAEIETRVEHETEGMVVEAKGV